MNYNIFMSNIIDYLKKYKDMTLNKKPFNEMDALIFSRLSYIDYDNFVSKRKYGNIRYLDVINLILLEESNLTRFRLKEDKELIDLLRSSLRFKDIYVRNYVDLFSKDESKQFSAITFFNKDKKNKFLLVTFRGTDGTLTGWREDFNLAYLDIIPSQKEAYKYLNKALNLTRFKKVYVVGHSKGGNLAIYAASNLNKNKIKLIDKIYAFDSPGFNDYFYNNSNFDLVKNKIYAYLPKSSIIGRLLNVNYQYKIVSSYELLLNQHNIYNWKVNNDEFILLNSFSAVSNKIDERIKNSLKGLKDEDKKQAIEEIFSTLETFSDEDKLETGNNLPNFFMKLKKELRNSSEKTKNLISSIFFKKKIDEEKDIKIENVEFEVLEENEFNEIEEKKKVNKYLLENETDD